MKKLFITTTLLFFLANYSNAQQLSDYYDASAANRPGFSYDITIKIQKTTGASDYDNRYTATLIQASPDSKGFYNAYYDKKFYSCSQLGDVCNPNNLHLISVRLTYTCNGQQKADVVVFKNLNDVKQINVVAGAGGKVCESIDFSMNVMGATLEPTHLGRIIDKINQLGTTKNSQTNIGASNGNYGNNPLSNINNNSSGNTSLQQGIERAQQITEVTTGLVELFTPSPEQIQRREQQAAEYARQKKIREDLEFQKREIEDRNRFDLLYLPLMDKAINGDENARMILYFASYNLLSSDKVGPIRREKWLDDAYANNNKDAILEKSKIIEEKISDGHYVEKNAIPYYEKAANLGSTDAMLILAEWYNLKKEFAIHGAGENAELALKYFKKAAELGSPNAMFHLGMIYKYGRSIKIDDVSGSTSNSDFKKKYVTYNIIIDEKKAFEYFVQSEQPNYLVSSFYRGRYKSAWRVCNGSYFNKGTFRELSIMYKDGKVTPKDKPKAKEYQTKYETYKLEGHY